MVAPPVHGWSRSVALVVAAAYFLEQVDGTILATATAAMADDFDVRPADVGVTVTAYFVAVSAFIPLSGWLSDRFGTRRIFLIAIAGFVAASVWCAMSPSLTMLVMGRVAQGIAGAMMVPVGRFIVLGAIAKADLVRAVAYLTWPALAAPVIAPLIGGVLTQYAGWQSIFYVNVPLGVALLGLAWRVIPIPSPTERRRLDPVNLVLVIVGVASLVIGLELFVDSGRVLAALSLVAVAGIGLVAAARRAWRYPTPLLDLRAFALPTFRASNTGGMVYRIAVSSAPFLLPLLLQDGFGWSPVQAGLMVMWVFVGNLAIKPLTTPMLRRIGFSRMIVGASIGIAVTFVVCACLSPQTPAIVTGAVLLLSGIFRSIGFTGYGTLQFADVPPGQMNGASTLSSAFSQLASGMGVALAAVGVRAVELSAPALDIFDDGLLGYRAALIAMATLALLSATALLRLPLGAAEHVRRPAYDGA